MSFSILELFVLVFNFLCFGCFNVYIFLFFSRILMFLVLIFNLIFSRLWRLCFCITDLLFRFLLSWKGHWCFLIIFLVLLRNLFLCIFYRVIPHSDLPSSFSFKITQNLYLEFYMNILIICSLCVTLGAPNFSNSWVWWIIFLVFFVVLTHLIHILYLSGLLSVWYVVFAYFPAMVWFFGDFVAVALTLIHLRGKVYLFKFWTMYSYVDLQQIDMRIDE